MKIKQTIYLVVRTDGWIMGACVTKDAADAYVSNSAVTCYAVAQPIERVVNCAAVVWDLEREEWHEQTPMSRNPYIEDGEVYAEGDTVAEAKENVRKFMASYVKRIK